MEESNRKNNIIIENVWLNKPNGFTEDVLEYWSRANLLPADQDAKNRAKQVVFTARLPDGKIIGLTTAFLVKYPPLKNTLFYFRGSLDPSFRIPGLFTKLTKATLTYLESIHKDLQPTPIGVLAEIENANLQKLRSVVTPAGFIFIGYNKAGVPVRVYYFDGARY